MPLPPGFQLIPSEGAGPNVPEGFQLVQEGQQAPPATDTPSYMRGIPGALEQGATPAEAIAGNPVTRFAVGAAKPFLGLASLGAHAADSTFGKALKKIGIKYPDFAKALDEHIMNYLNLEKAGQEFYGGGPNVSGLAGQVLSPVGLGAAKALPEAATLLGRVGQGATLGAVYGVTNPVENPGPDFWVKKIEQGGIGALIGAAIPAGMSLLKMPAKAVYHLIEPWLPGGRTAILNRALQQAAGPKRTEIAKAIEQWKGLPGESASVGEMAAPAGSAEFSGLQKIMEGVQPTPYTALGQAQNVARREALTSVAQTPAVQRAVGGQIAKEATQNYTRAYEIAKKSGLAPTESLAGIFQNPFVKDAIPDAAKLMRAKGLDTQTDVLPFLHYTKVSLDKMLEKTGDNALGRAEKSAVMDAKTALVKWMTDNAPAYGRALKTFQAGKRVEDQMALGQYLKDKLSPALADFGAEPSQRAATYAQALRDAPGTIKRATDFAGPQRLDEILGPEQMRMVQGVGESLANKARYDALAKAGGKSAAKILGVAEEPPVPLPHILERSIVIANTLLSRLQGKVNERMLQDLATRMRENPLEVAKILKEMPPDQRKSLIQEAMRVGATGTAAIGAAKGTGG